MASCYPQCCEKLVINLVRNREIMTCGNCGVQIRQLRLEMDDKIRIHEEEKQMIQDNYKEGNQKLKLANQQLKVGFSY